jgi:cell division protein FtsZ
LPAFFLPFTKIPVETAKGLLVVIGIVVSVIAWAAARFSDGKIYLPKSYISLGVLFNVIGGPDLTMNEVDEAAKIISQAADSDANIIFGATIDETMRDQMKITVIATGFDSARQTLREFVAPPINQNYHQNQNVNFGQSNQPQEENQNQNQNQNLNQNPTNNPPAQETDEEVWDIPAFLRQKN